MNTGHTEIKANPAIWHLYLRKKMTADEKKECVNDRINYWWRKQLLRQINARI